MLKFFVLLYFLFFYVDFAGAYIDPGTGTYLLQLLIAGAAAGLYATKVFWKQIKGFSVNP